MPSYPTVERFIELGGTRITFGSDAHSEEFIGLNFDLVMNDQTTK